MDEKNKDSIGYAFKGKIMISSITILLAACFAIVAFHVCRRRRDSSPGAAASSRGVDVKSLPTFVYRSENEESPPECAVCLSELEEGEAGRILPECKHCFHVDCIDAWLRARGHCPLCRADCTVVSIREAAGQSDGIRICCPLGPGPSSSENPVGRDHADLDRSLGQDPGCPVARFWL